MRVNRKADESFRSPRIGATSSYYSCPHVSVQLGSAHPHASRTLAPFSRHEGRVEQAGWGHVSVGDRAGSGGAFGKVGRHCWSNIGIRLVVEFGLEIEVEGAASTACFNAMKRGYDGYGPCRGRPWKSINERCESDATEGTKVEQPSLYDEYEVAVEGRECEQQQKEKAVVTRKVSVVQVLAAQSNDSE